MDVQELLDLTKSATGETTDSGLATKLGVTKQAVSGWRNGKAQPDTVTCAAIAGFTGVPLAKVLGIVGEARAISREEKAVWRKLAATAAVALCAIGLSIGGSAKAAQDKAFEDMAPDSHVSNAYYVQAGVPPSVGLALAPVLLATAGHPTRQGNRSMSRTIKIDTTWQRIELTGPWAGFGFQAGHLWTPEDQTLHP